MKSPKNLKILTWNINSIRIRLEQLEIICRRLKPDLLCLQETKTKNEAFPYKKCSNIGFPYIIARGNSGYNGVAVLSKYPLTVHQQLNFCGYDDSRHLAVQVFDLLIHNFYVPAGGYEPSIITNPKFLHKLNFLEEMINFFKSQELQKTIILGDLNVAPFEYDVWDHTQMLKTVSHTPDEIKRFKLLLKSGPFIDAVRNFIPEPKQVYTWWSYRSPNWFEVDKGRRLDHLWITPDLQQNLSKIQIFKAARSLVRPSDHVPVMIKLKF